MAISAKEKLRLFRQIVLNMQFPLSLMATFRMFQQSRREQGSEECVPQGELNAPIPLT